MMRPSQLMPKVVDRRGVPSGAAFVAFCTSLTPWVAHACPMCFSGNNSGAYVYGSLFMMFMPVLSIGSLIYWGYRRVRAQDEAANPPVPVDLPADTNVRPLHVSGSIRS
jgi:hypothetical protein